MPRQFENRIKVSQIIENQLPKFIRDNVITSEITQSSVSGSGTYVRSGKTVTITSTNHELNETDRLKLDYISGSGTDGFYSVRTVIDQNTFTVEDEVSGKTNGTVNYEQYATVVGLEPSNISSVSGNYDKFIEFLKQYYISQEYQGSSYDLIDNLDQYLRLDNLIPEVIVGSTKLTSTISSTSKTISVESTKGFPEKYGLLKINDEIITYTQKTETSFLGCVRGFSGITNYHDSFQPEELVFSKTDSSSHIQNSLVENLSVLFLQEFYKKIKYSLVPGLEDKSFVSELNVGNFIKESRSLYETKGTEESFRILFNILYGVNPKVIDLKQYLFRPSDAKFTRREVSVVERISGNPLNLKGQTIFKSDDEFTFASVSEVEPITKGGKIYYKLFLFVGYDDVSSSISGNFIITPSTKVSDNVLITKNLPETVSVDSTIGFPNSGNFVYEGEIISYEEKSINQFFNCTIDSNSSNSTISLKKKDNITTSELYFGFENGDINKKVELRFTGVLSGIVFKEDNADTADRFNYIEGDEIFVKNLGEVIKNSTDENKSRKEILSNSWIYNTNCRFQIDSSSIFGNQFSIFSSIDKSSLSEGDFIEFLERDTELVIVGLENALVVSILNGTITTNVSLSPLLSTENYDIRRIQKKASSISSLVPLKYGNNKITSDILNVYNNNDEHLYVASNSLPSYSINPRVYAYNVSGILDTSYNPETEKYSVLQFDEVVSFLTGDRIYYKFSDSPIEFLEEKDYYVEVLENKREIKLYSSLSLIGSSDYLEFSNISATLPNGIHTFILFEQKDIEISPQTLLRKFSVNPEIDQDGQNEVLPGPVGMLINGVEILSFKTNDKIYYGPLENIRILNNGTDYDVINPPLLQISSGNAKLQPVVTGSVKNIFVDLQTFDIDTNISVQISGGNGSGAEFQPVVVPFQREMEFDARQISEGGGIDFEIETISFLFPHGLINGQVVIYDKNNNEELGIGTYFGENFETGNTFIDGGEYYAKLFNNTTIQLYPSISDLNSGINTIGITSIGNRGIHKFKTRQTNRLKEILILNEGSGYSNRKLRVRSSGISTSDYTINFPNHGFSNGEIVDYTYEDADLESSSPIVGLSTNVKFNILKLDDNRFRVCDAGIGGTDISNFARGNYVKFDSIGSGYQIFKYPDISLNVTYSIPGVGSTTIVGQINATPVVRGRIEDVYIYENGSDYGSNILNLKSIPRINVKNGSSAQFRPIISNGRIISVQIQYGGVDYYSYPDIVAIGDGSGAILRPIVENNKIVSVIVVDSGSGYTIENTSIIPISAGKNVKFDVNIRSLSVNNAYKFGEFIELPTVNDFYRKPSDEIISRSFNNTLQYSILGYSSNIASKFNDDGINHSSIIGWAYDGNPIYGPYGYSDPESIDSPIKLLQSGYVLSSIENRPAGFDFGFFVEDHIFNGSGDLDEYNGRFCKTPEFPEGTYAYFSTVEVNPFDFNSLVGKFPYFIGNYYRTNFDQLENLFLNQGFDFNSSNLIRNTLPYKVNDSFAKNDFIIESNKIQRQKVVVESINSGDLTGFNIISPGNNYKVSDRIIFDADLDQNQTSILARVSEINGKDIEKITTEVTDYENSILTWVDNDKVKVTILPNHDLENNDRVVISDISESLSKLSGEYRIGVSTFISRLAFDLEESSVTGIATDIVLTTIPTKISIGSSIKIGNEILPVLGVYENLNTLRVLRSGIGTSHTESSEIYFIPDSFIIFEDTDNFDSKLDSKIFFNPNNSVGVGTTPGSTYELNYYIGKTKVSTSVPIQSIYIPNHPFKTNQKVIFKKPTDSPPILVSEGINSPVFNLPFSGDSQTVYIINKSKDYIGIITSLDVLGVATATDYNNGLFFLDGGGNNDLYSIDSTFKQEKCTISRVKSTIFTKNPHFLRENDSIDLVVNVDGIVGFETYKVKYVEKNNALILDEREIIVSGINTATNTINLPLHGYSTGDKIYYTSTNYTGEGFVGGEYFIYKVDDNNFRLSETLIDSTSDTPKIVGINSSGNTGQFIAKINPQINIVKDNNLVFDLSDNSLINYKFKIFYDKDFKKEFVSNKTLGSFSVTGIGTVGISSDASVILKYSDDNPISLFYAIERDAKILSPDKEVENFSNILFVDSEYTGNFKVYNTQGVASTSFNISLKKRPEKISYNTSETSVLKYTTNSQTASGGVNKIKIFNKGVEYKKIPSFSRIESENGVGAYIVPKSSTIGSPKETRIIINGFDYSSDKTLRPEASLPSLCTIKNSEEIVNIEIINSGNNYQSPPDLIVINPETNEIIDNGILRTNLSGSSIGSVTIEISPKGLPPTPVTIKAINNTNGISISQVQSSPSGIVTCILTTPISGFGTDPFSAGDKIYVEGIVKDSDFGSGFNSSDYNHQFFTVSNYFTGSNPGKLEYDLSLLTTNPGVAKTIQDSFSSIIKQENYPEFRSIQSPTKFFIGESLLTDSGFGFEMRDLIVKSSTDTFIRVFGTYDLEKDEIIKGSESFNLATIDSIKRSSGRFEVNSFSSETIGWSDDTGKIGETFQVIPDNDYYQNLSYTIKSTKTWEEIVSPVNSLLHTSGLKNFSDTEFIKTAKVSPLAGISTARDSDITITSDFITESRIDTINDFDLVIDIDIS
jgi:hypothetical protein